MNIVLIGYRGSGKTTVARHVAVLLGWDWVDADVEVELRAGKSIAAIFAGEGEPAFRELESRALAELTARDRLVVAAGGGAVLREDNREALAHCRVVWLVASVETLLARVSADATTAARRPNLTTAGGASEVRRLLAEREPLYRQLAEVSVRTDDRSAADIAREIVERLAIDTAQSE